MWWFRNCRNAKCKGEGSDGQDSGESHGERMQPSGKSILTSVPRARKEEECAFAGRNV